MLWSSVWSLADMADVVRDALEERERSLRDEQAVRGLDSLDEVALHPMIAGALDTLGFGVLREQPYPHEWSRKAARTSGPDTKRTPAANEPQLVLVGSTDAFPDTPPAADALPKHRDRQRCDIVLTPEPNQTLADALLTEAADRKRKSAARGTLFETLAASEPRAASPPGSIPPEDAFWLEVKVVAQFDLSSGVPGFARAYASSLTKSLTGDLHKLAEDPRIHRGGVLLVLFTLDRATADHDLPIALHRCLDRELPITTPETRRFDITDRLGNALCSLCLVGLRRPL